LEVPHEIFRFSIHKAYLVPYHRYRFNHADGVFECAGRLTIPCVIVFAGEITRRIAVNTGCNTHGDIFNTAGGGAVR
jgi:hypothetical protein